MSFVSRYQRELGVAAAYAALLALLGITRPAFFQTQFAATWVTMAPVLIAAIGMTLIIIARQIDISIGSQFSVCAITAALAAKAGTPMPLVLLIAVAGGAVMGAMNGAMVALLKMPSIVVTLATMVILREALRLHQQGEAVSGLPDTFQWFGASQTHGQLLLVIISVVALLIFAWAMRFLPLARSVYAVGSDEEAARLSGIRPARVVFAVFVLGGALTGLASMLQAVRFAQVDPNAGLGLELQVIAAVVVGGTAISGGRGTPLGTLLGVALLITIGPALVFFNIPPQWERAIRGLIILLAVASDALRRPTHAGV